MYAFVIAVLSEIFRMLSRFSRVRFFVTLWTVTCQPPLSMGFSKQEYQSQLPCSLPGNLPNPGIKPGFPALQVDSLLLSHREAWISSDSGNTAWLWNTASHCSGFSCCRAQALGHVGSVVVAHRPQITGSVTVAHGPSCPEACGILPQQGLNMCFLHC